MELQIPPSQNDNFNTPRRGVIDPLLGFSYQKEWILRNKRLPECVNRFNGLESASIEDLISIYEDALYHGYGASIWSSRTDYVVELVEKGSQSEDSYSRVQDQLTKWIADFDDQKFLYYQLQSLDQKYYLKKSQAISFRQAIDLVIHRNLPD